MAPVRFAIVGGVIGDVHARAIASLGDGAELSVVASTREARAALAVVLGLYESAGSGRPVAIDDA